MRSMSKWLCAGLFPILLLSACNDGPASGEEAESPKVEMSSMTQYVTTDTLAENPESTDRELVNMNSADSQPDKILNSYYEAQSSPVYEYFQSPVIKKFLTMWVKDETGDILNPEWNYENFSKIQILDHDLMVSRPDESLYCLTFSAEGERYGYVIVKYEEDGPAVSNWGVTETTPYSYDLKADWEEIRGGLMKTDIDLQTAEASRVYLLDRDHNRADQVILFTDDKGDHYICYFGDTSLEIKKW